MATKKTTTPNLAHYYVWEMKLREPTEPLRQVNKAPLELKPAKQLARIGAKEGKYDRAVTTSPEKRDLEVVAHYERGTGKNIKQKLWRR